MVANQNQEKRTTWEYPKLFEKYLRILWDNHLRPKVEMRKLQ